MRRRHGRRPRRRAARHGAGRSLRVAPARAVRARVPLARARWRPAGSSRCGPAAAAATAAGRRRAAPGGPVGRGVDVGGQPHVGERLAVARATRRATRAERAAKLDAERSHVCVELVRRHRLGAASPDLVERDAGRGLDGAERAPWPWRAAARRHRGPRPRRATRSRRASARRRPGRRRAARCESLLGQDQRLLEREVRHAAGRAAQHLAPAARNISTKPVAGSTATPWTRWSSRYAGDAAPSSASNCAPRSAERSRRPSSGWPLERPDAAELPPAGCDGASQ